MDSKQKGPVKKRPDVGWDIVFANLLGSALYNLLKLPNAWLNILLFFVAIPLLTLNLYWYCWRQRQKRNQGESQPR